MFVDMNDSKEKRQIVSCTKSSPRVAFEAADSLANAQSIGGALHDKAYRSPNAPACWYNRRSTTISQLNERSNRIAQALVLEGIQVGDRVAYIAESSDRYFELLFGCAKSGAVLVPINSNLGTGRIKEIIEACDAKIVFSDDTTAILVENIHRQCQSRFCVIAIDNLAHAHWRNLAQWYNLCRAQAPMITACREQAVLQLFAINDRQYLETVIYTHAHFLDNLSPRCFAFTQALPLPTLENTSTLIITPVSELSASYLGIQGIVSGSLVVVVGERCEPKALARVLSQFKVASMSLPSENITMCTTPHAEEPKLRQSVPS